LIFGHHGVVRCRGSQAILEEFAGEYTGKVQVIKVNTDESAKYAAQLGVQAIPTMIFFKGGKEVQRVIGSNLNQRSSAILKPLPIPNRGGGVAEHSFQLSDDARADVVARLDRIEWPDSWRATHAQ
jgi:thioredoxin-like negative regulator of GroEL